MKHKDKLPTYLLIILAMTFTLSCGQTTNSGSEAAFEEGDEHEMEGMEHKVGEVVTTEGYTWIPSQESMAMMEYKTHNITLATSGDEDVLMFEPAGQRASCMFKNKHGNIGLTATIKIEEPEASVKLLHHSTGRNNYEFVSLEGGIMKLGRVKNGEEKIFDSKEIEVPEDWFTLTVTAAGTNYQGYINDIVMTSGQADIMEPGLLGIVASGNGTISVKKIEVKPLKVEH